MAPCVDVILSDGIDEGTGRFVVEMTDTTAFRVFIGIVEDASPIPEKIKLDHVMIWLWNATSNNLWKTFILVLSALLRSGPHIGLPACRIISRNDRICYGPSEHHKMT
jgi:hypothetical protein